MNYRINLSTRSFPSYRRTNILLSGLLGLALAFIAWQLVRVFNYSDAVRSLDETAGAAQVEWSSLEEQLSELRSRLQRPESQVAVEEIQFLNTVISRKRFSWTAFLEEIEKVIPRGVYLASLQPQVEEPGDVLVRMEARGRSVEDLSQFIRALEGSDTFQGVNVLNEARLDEEGSTEVLLLMTVQYGAVGEDSP